MKLPYGNILNEVVIYVWGPQVSKHHILELDMVISMLTREERASTSDNLSHFALGEVS